MKMKIIQTVIPLSEVPFTNFYNFTLDGNYNYYANDILVLGKGKVDNKLALYWGYWRDIHSSPEIKSYYFSINPVNNINVFTQIRYLSNDNDYKTIKFSNKSKVIRIDDVKGELQIRHKNEDPNTWDTKVEVSFYTRDE